MIDNLTRRAFGLTASVFGLGLARPATAASDEGLAASLQFVDPELRGPLEPAGGPRIPMLREQQIPAYRSQSEQAFPSPLPSPPVRVEVIPGRGNAPPVKIYVVDGGGGAVRGAVLHIHGGGYILGSPQSDLPNLQRIAGALGCLIASVDYRLAPETRYPGSLEDNYAALLWLRDQAQRLRVDPSRIVVMGESAGGGHAAALALAARDRGEVRLAGQVLVFPMLDDRTGSGRRPPAQEGTFIWTPELNRLGWTALLGVPAGSSSVPAGAVPARVENLAGLPPTFIGVGALDLFVREDIEYARRLVDAGVPTELLVVPGAYHAFEFLVPTAAVSRRFSQTIDDTLSRMLRPAAA